MREKALFKLSIPNILQNTTMSSHARYDALVIAVSAEEAIAIASEATPHGLCVVDSKAIDVSVEHGPHTWQVSLRFGANGRVTGYRPKNDFPAP